MELEASRLDDRGCEALVPEDLISGHESQSEATSLPDDGAPKTDGVDEVVERLSRGDEAERDTAAHDGSPSSSSPPSGTDILDLLDEGWFASNVASNVASHVATNVGGWFGGRFFGGGFSLSTIKEAQNEAEEQGEDEGSAEKGGPQGSEGPEQSASPSPSGRSSAVGEDPRNARDPPGFEPDGGGVGGGMVAGSRGWRRTASPCSSDEESVKTGNRQGGRRRGRSGARRRTKRSSSAENARGSWYGEVGTPDGAGGPAGPGERPRGKERG